MSRGRVSLIVLAVAGLLLFVLVPDVVLVVFAGVLVAIFLRAGGGRLGALLHTGTVPGIALFIPLLVLVAAAGFTWFWPAMTEQAGELSVKLPEAIEALVERVESFAWGERLIERAVPGLFSGQGSAATSAVTSTFGALGNFIIILFIGLYGALNPAPYRNGLIGLFAPLMRPRAGEIADRIVSRLRDWLAAQLMAMTVVGVLTGVGLWFLGIPLAFLLGVIAGLLAFIPNIGPVLAAVPGILLAFPEGMTTVALVIAVYAGVQALESYVVTPLLQKEKTALPPAFVIAMQLLMGVMLGLLGLALATPLAAAFLTLFREAYVRDYLDRDDPGHAAGRS